MGRLTLRSPHHGHTHPAGVAKAIVRMLKQIGLHAALETLPERIVFAPTNRLDSDQAPPLSVVLTSGVLEQLGHLLP